MRKIYKLLMSLVAMLAMAPVGLQAQSGNWTDDGNRAASFSSQSDNTITIKNEAEFALLAYNVNNGTHYHGTTFVLDTDLNMGDHYWTPIGTPDNPFRGNFNGANHTIDGITVNTTNNYAGLFGYVAGREFVYYEEVSGNVWGWNFTPAGYIKDFVMTNANIKGGDYTGGVVGRLSWQVTVENVICQANVTGGNHVGGLIGREDGEYVQGHPIDPTIKNSLLTGGKITATGNDKGALVGSASNNTHSINNFYTDPASAVGNSLDVRAYPVYVSKSDGVTVTYNNGSTGVVYNNILYHPAGTVNFNVAYPLIPLETISVAVNGTPKGNQVGDYQITISAETAPHQISVEVGSSGITGAGTAETPYIINTPDQWDICAAAVGSGDSYNGVYFKLGSPITVTTMMGTNDNQPFSGIFDGGGNTLTLDYGKSNDYLDQECGAFYRLNNATIKNLVIAGSIYSSAQHNGGLAVKATGQNNHIENCVSSVSINSNISGDCTNGGFIGWLNTEITRVWFDGCAFTGELVGANAQNWGGFVGWRHFRGDGQENWNHNYVTFTDCLFAPTTVNISEGGNSRTFCRSYMNYTDGASYNNCYYTTLLEAVDGGRQMHTITAGEGVTLANAGTITTYSLSGITSYGVGIKYGDVLYAGSGDNVSLTLSGSATNQYICGETALLGHENPYTLRMPNADAVISAWNVAVPTTLASVSDWNTFCTAVNGGYDYLGETVTLTANVGTFEDPVNTKAGDNDHPFKGTFDGGGHTLTIGYGSSSSYSDQKCAPFYRLNNATIKNLVVAGSIYSSAQHNAGIAARATGSNNHIQNCVSHVSINSNIDGDCSNGGFIGLLDVDGSRINFNGCAFTGELLGASTTNWGGFVGLQSWTDNNYCYLNFVDCIFFPKTVNISNDGNSQTFCRVNNTSGDDFSNCYYSQSLRSGGGGTGSQIYSITPGEGVTALANTADVVVTYTVSHIIRYGSGIKFNDVLYAKSGDNVSLNITGTSTTGHYICGETALLGHANPYTLQMPNGNAVISEWNVTPPVTIASVSDWEDFCTAVNAGYNYQGETVTMTADVGTDADPAVTKAGTDDNHPFRGTFDGGGHTLTIGYGSSSSYSDQKCAPFYRLNNATIRNLVVAGHIYSSTQHNGGIATSAYGKNNHIENCVSNVSIHSNRSGNGDAGDCTNGGFIGVLKTNRTYVNFVGCAFTGQLLGENATNWGGFVGWRFYESSYESINYNNAYFTNCLFAPTTVSIKLEGGNSRPFCRSYNGNGAEYTNCYYTNALQGDFGGKQAYSTATLPANIGEAGTNYGFVTAYANGLKFAGSHYMAPEAVSLANDAANSTNLSGKNGYFATVTLTDRTLYKDANWNTLCLPFDLALEGSALDGAEARTLSKATFNAGTLTLNFSEPVSELTAGTPYILRWKDASADLVSPVFNGVIINSSEPVGITPTDINGKGSVTFVGTYDPIQYASANRSVLFLGGNSNLYYPDGKSTTTIGACRAYFQLNDITAGDPSDPSSSVRAFVLNFGDENPSGINSLTPALSRGDEAIYNLAGQKLNKMQKGINIINGKKILK